MLTSERVRLRALDADLARGVLDGLPRPGMAWAEGFPGEPLRQFLRKVLEDQRLLGPFYGYLIIRASDGAAVGDVGFHGPPGPSREVEIGYALASAARGEGLATEAVSLLLGWALTQPGVDLVSARVERRNEHAAQSERLLARLGFQPDGAHDGTGRFVLGRSQPAGASA